MINQRFRFIIVFRVFFLSATLFFLFFLIFRTSLYAITFITAFFILFQIYSLIVYVEKTNRDLNRFLQAVKYEDFSQTFIGAGLGSSFNELKEAFNDILRKFRDTRAEKEEHYHYLQTVVEHIGIGLLSFQQNGEIELINKAAKRLFNVRQLKNIKSLESFSPVLVKTLLQLKPGDKALVKVEDENELIDFMVYATEFVMRGNKFTLVSVQNIQSELEEKEMEAWQKLIRVLTHEIMNSVTPIASMASTMNDILSQAVKKRDKKGMIRVEMIDDVCSAMQAIHKRSEGLVHFVESYRSLTRIPKPDFEIFPVSSLFNRVYRLMETQLNMHKITFRIEIDPESLN